MKIQNVPYKVVENLNEVGQRASDCAKRFGEFTKSKADMFVKKNLAADKALDLNKNTVIGAGITIATLVLALKCIKGVVAKVMELKEDK